MMIKNSIQGGKPVLSKSMLHGYQKRAVDFIVNKHNVALFLDMGL
jgi:hypothetical protein